MCKECLYLCYLMVYLYLNPKQNGLAQRFPSPKDTVHKTLPTSERHNSTFSVSVGYVRHKTLGDPCDSKHDI